VYITTALPKAKHPIAMAGLDDRSLLIVAKGLLWRKE
jgi:hypothetical protein